MLIVGKPGSGKTHLISELLTNPDFYYKKFDHVLLITPSGLPGFSKESKYYNAGVDLVWLHDHISNIAKNKPGA